jgi:hypothetical protein
VDFAYTGYSRARGKTERDRTRKKCRTHSNRDGLKWGENNVRSEQTKEKMKMYIIPKYTPAHSPTAQAKYCSAKAAEASSSVAD